MTGTDSEIQQFTGKGFFGPTEFTELSTEGEHIHIGGVLNKSKKTRRNRKPRKTMRRRKSKKSIGFLY